MRKKVLGSIALSGAFVLVSVFFANTRLGFNTLEELGESDVRLAPSVGLRKPQGWAIVPHKITGYEAVTRKIDGLNKVGIHAIPVSKLSASAPFETDKALGDAIMKYDEAVASKWAADKSFVPESYVKYVKEFRFESFGRIENDGRPWGKHTSRRDARMWVRLFTPHAGVVVVVSYQIDRSKADGADIGDLLSGFSFDPAELIP